MWIETHLHKQMKKETLFGEAGSSNRLLKFQLLFSIISKL